jgi:ATP-binding cassette subfamily B (MDR/TAP) protein 1
MDATGGRDGEEKKGNGKGAIQKSVSFMSLFRYADGTDVVLMILGTVGAMANGVSEPILMVIFGQVINAFGGAVGVDDVLSRVNKVSSPEIHPPRYL